MECKQKKYDCIFCVGERCTILSDTNFNRPCPFFKRGIPTIEQERYFQGKAEAFKAIPGTANRYFVSELGEVVNWHGRPLSRKHNSHGMPIVTYTTESGKSTSRGVASLVADAFLPGAGMIGYKDGDPENCERWNLERIERG